MKHKIFKVMFAIVLTFAITLCGIGYSSASSAPSNVTMQRADRVDDFVLGGVYGFTEFKTTEGNIMYCLDVNKTPLTQNQSASLSGEADAGILYILENGYPKKNIVRSTSESFYITQAAIWWYLDETQGVSIRSDFKNSDNVLVTNYIKPLVEKAIEAKNNGYSVKEPSMEVTTNGDELTLTSDGKYYESPMMSAALVNADSYSVIVSGATANTVVVSESGETKSTFNSSENFKVRIPESELTSDLTISVKISVNGAKESAKIYSPSDGSYQRVVGLFDDEKALVKEVTLKVSPETTGVEVSVPNTSANIILLSVLGGVVAVIAGIGIVIYRHKREIKA